MFKIINKKIFIKIIIILFFNLHFAKVYAAFLSNGFLVTSGLYDKVIVDDEMMKCVSQTGSRDTCLCSVKIFYPKINYSNKQIADKINNTILNFVNTFNSCERVGVLPIQKIVNYQFPDSGYKNYFSIKFMKQEGMLTQKQYAFTFDKRTGNLLSFSDVFIESEKFKEFMIKNFSNLLDKENEINKFFNTISSMFTKHKIQFYLETGLFHLVFNKSRSDKTTRVIDIVVPKNFIKVSYVKS